MRVVTRILLTAVMVGPIAPVVGCVQLPTEKQAVADMRPSISFRMHGSNPSDAKVYIDEMQMGVVGDYLDGQSALRVLPGSHLLRVVDGDRVLMNEKVYLGDGVNRVFIVK